MTRGRQLPDRDYQVIKAATRRLIDAAGGPVAAAEVTRGAHQDMSRYGSAHPDNAGRFMPVDVLADLESETEQPILTKSLAKLAGFLLVPEPKVALSGSALGVITSKALKETSEVFVALADATLDGKVCSADADNISREIDEAMAKLAALKLQVRAEAEAGK